MQWCQYSNSRGWLHSQQKLSCINLQLTTDWKQKEQVKVSQQDAVEMWLQTSRELAGFIYSAGTGLSPFRPTERQNC